MKKVVLAFIALLGACTFFEDPQSVEIRQLGGPCTFLDKPSGPCANSVVGNDGKTCMPPVGYEFTETTCDGIDNDCDGVADVGCECNVQNQARGACARGTISVDGSCTPPSDFGDVDVCGDEVDNNCDGSIDEGCICEYNGQSNCESSVGPEGLCSEPQRFEGEETLCDGIDNDCDGEVDENLTMECAKTTGACEGSKVTCEGGMYPECDDSVYSSRDSYESVEQLCDRIDNDCDGAVDEDCPCNYRDLPTGVCFGLARDETGECPVPDLYNATELCDGEDNNCNGAVDEGCNCVSGIARSCGIATGECIPGTQVCTNDLWGDCEGAVGPSEETCNMLDDNCDGTVDEFLVRDCAVQEGVCAGSTVACFMGSFPQCGSIHFQANSRGYQTNETTCDGVDNDCDGVSDESCPCGFNGTSVGVCGTAAISDVDGLCKQPPSFEANETACDGLDNDCNGSIDSGCPCNYLGLPMGVCANAILDGGGNCLPPVGYAPSDANCDNLDNDCDGSADEDTADSESNCADRKDNDCDGKTDCNDPDCEGQICGSNDTLPDIINGVRTYQQSIEQIKNAKFCVASSCK